MSEAKFTPGPWSVAKNDHDDLRWIEDHAGHNVCDLFRWGLDAEKGDSFFGKPNAKANADLIAAAPDLYATLERIVYEHDCAVDRSNPFIEAGRKALAKARGES